MTRTVLDTDSIRAAFDKKDADDNDLFGKFEADGTLKTIYLPSLARITPSVVASEAAMLALDAQAGDVAVRTDLDPDRSFMLGGDGNPATLANWIPISFAISGAAANHNLFSATHPDVDATDAPAAGEFLGFDADGKWRAKPAPSGGGSSLATGVFRAYKAAGSAAGTNTNPVIFDTENYDVSGWHDPVTGRFTPQLAGIYRLDTQLSISAGTAGLSNIQIYKNGVVVVRRYFQSSTNEGGYAAFADVEANGTTDYFTVGLSMTASGNTFGLGSDRTFFSGRFIGTKS